MFDFKPYLETLSKPNKPENGVGDNYISTLVKVKHGKKEEGQSETLAALRKYAANHVLLLGNPGSGKSTALKQLLQEEAVKCLNNNKRQPIPVFIKLSQLGTKDSFRGELTFPNLIIKELKSSGITTTEQVGQLLLEGDLLLLLDGLNEVITDEYKTQIEQIEKDFSKTQMIFSSRLLGTETYFIEDSLHIQPLTEKQAKDFAYKELGHDTANKMLRNPQWRSRELFYNPLFLWMLCETSQSKSPPENQGDLFRQFTQEEYKKYKRAIVSKDASFYNEVMQELAFLMIQAGGNEKNLWLQISRNQAEEQLKRYFKKEGESDPLSKAKIWLNKALEQHLLQCASEESSIEFPHQLFQEYYAAEWLLSCLDKLSDEQLCANYLNPIKWTESILMIMDLISNKVQAEHIINQALSVDITLAAILSGRVKEEWQKEIFDILLLHLEKNKIDKYVIINIVKLNHTKYAIKIIIEFLENNRVLSEYALRQHQWIDLLDIVFGIECEDSFKYAIDIVNTKFPSSATISPNQYEQYVHLLKIRGIDIKENKKGVRLDSTIKDEWHIKWRAMLALWKWKKYEDFLSHLHNFLLFLPRNEQGYAELFYTANDEGKNALCEIINYPEQLIKLRPRANPQEIYKKLSIMRIMAIKALANFTEDTLVLDKLANLCHDKDHAVCFTASNIIGKVNKKEPTHITPQILNINFTNSREETVDNYASGYCKEKNINEIFQDLLHKRIDVRNYEIGRIFDYCPNYWSKLTTWVSNHAPELSEPLRILQGISECKSEDIESAFSLLQNDDFPWKDILIGKIKTCPKCLPKLKQLSLQQPELSQQFIFLSILRKSQNHHNYSYEWFEKSKKLLTILNWKNQLSSDENFEFLPVVKKIHITLSECEKFPPETYKGMGENGVRNYLSASLQACYSEVATVTRETENRNGKTDILIKKTNGNNEFIAECKIWPGKKTLSETINQLLGYSIRTDTKAAIVFFVHDQDIRKVISNARQQIKKHSNFIKYHEEFEHSSHGYHCLFRSTAANDSDINLAILFYHFLQIEKKHKEKEGLNETNTS